MTIPPYILDLLRTSMVGDWYGNLLYGLGAVLVAAMVMFVVALATER